MQSLRHALAPVVSYKAWLAALVLSVSSFLPVYRAPIVFANRLAIRFCS